MDAAGDIGSSSARVNVDLVQGPQTPVIEFSAIAGQDIYLDVKGRAYYHQ